MAWEIEYRPATEEGDEALPPRDWRRVSRLESDFGDITISGLEHGAAYEVRVREVVDEVVGPWVYAEPVAASKGSRAGSDGIEIPPPPPRNLRIEKDGCLYWDYLEGVPDLAGFEIRHAPEDYRHFADAQPAHTGLVAAPPYELCGVPRGLRTVMVRAVNEVGVGSTPTVIVVDRGAFDDAEPTTVETLAEAPAFAGTIEGGSVVSDVLTPDLTGRYWPRDLNRPYWPQDLEETYWQDVPDDLVYTFDFTPTDQPAVDAVLSLAVAAEGRNWKVFYRQMDQPYWPENLNDPYWPLLGNSYWPAIDLSAPYWQDTDEPYWPEDLSEPYWPDANRPWPGRLAHLRHAFTRFEVRVPGGQYPMGSVSTLTPRLSTPTPATPAEAPVVLAEADGDVPGGRVLTAGDGIVAADDGAGGNLTVHAGSHWTHDLIPAPLTITNIPAPVTEADRSRLRVDLTRATSARLMRDVSTAATGAAMAKVQYSSNGSSWSDLGPAVSLAPASFFVGAWEAIPEGAKADVYLRVVTYDGNGSDDPVIDRMSLQVR